MKYIQVTSAINCRLEYLCKMASFRRKSRFVVVILWLFVVVPLREEPKRFQFYYTIIAGKQTVILLVMIQTTAVDVYYF